MKFIDLFCGIGGFRVALERAGYQCVFSSEIDAHARTAYAVNFGGEKPAGDITQISAGDIPRHDILCGGFPCQSFSLAGNQKGMDDPRGQMFFEIVRIARHHRPRLMLLENVPRILSIDDGQVMQTILKTLATIGYACCPLVLNAGHYGYAQNRIRVYFVCVYGHGINLAIPKPIQKDRALINVMEPCCDVDKRYDFRGDWDAIRWNARAESRQRSLLGDGESAGRIYLLGVYGTGGVGQRIMSPYGYASTLTTQSNSRGWYLIDGRIRSLTRVEGKRIMGFPDDYVLSRGWHGWRQLGNAVIPGMVKQVFDAAMKKN